MSSEKHSMKDQELSLRLIFFSRNISSFEFKILNLFRG